MKESGIRTMNRIYLLVLSLAFYCNADFSCQKSKILQLAGDVNSTAHTGINKIEETPNSIIIHYVDKPFSQGDFCEILLDSLSTNEIESLYSDTKNFSVESTDFCPEINEVSNFPEILTNILGKEVNPSDTVNVQIKELKASKEDILSDLKSQLPFKYLRFNSPKESKTPSDIHVSIKKQGCRKIEALIFRYYQWPPNEFIGGVGVSFDLNLDNKKVTANNPEFSVWLD